MKVGLLYLEENLGVLLKCSEIKEDGYLFERPNGQFVLLGKEREYKRLDSPRYKKLFEGDIKKPTTLSITNQSWEYILQLMQANGYTNFNQYFEIEVMQLLENFLDPDAEIPTHEVLRKGFTDARII